MSRLPITVIMLTLNEEYNLSGAIDDVKNWAEELFIVDSCSTDKTVDIALGYGVKVVQRPFTNFGDQWNFALENLPIKTSWTLKLDPDEHLTDELKTQIEAVVHDPNALDAYSFPRRLWFMGKPLHVKASVLRLWKTGKCRFSDTIINEHPLINGKVGHLSGLMEHYDSKDLHHWVDKQNRYSTMRAIEMVKGAPYAAKPRFFGSALERHMFFKKLFWSLPFRYFLLWLYLVVVKKAFLCGYRGLCWAHLRTQVYKWAELKAWEMRSRGKILQIPKAPHGDYDPRVVTTALQQSVCGKQTGLL